MSNRTRLDLPRPGSPDVMAELASGRIRVIMKRDVPANREGIFHRKVGVWQS